MIPLPLASLKNIGVLVTRPAEQADELCKLIEKHGGHAWRFPTIAIAACPHRDPIDSARYDWLIFTSANAVQHGLPQIRCASRNRYAAIGKATAAALAAHEIQVDALPEGRATTESLLDHPAFANLKTQRALVVKGTGGREKLIEELTARGAQVDTADVYERLAVKPDPALVAAIEQQWRDGEIDVVTVTSVEILDRLLESLTPAGKQLLAITPFVTVSDRIVAAARERGLTGECILARTADDDSLVGAIAAWHARAR